MFSKKYPFYIYFPCLGSPRSFINPGGGGSNHNYSEMEMNHLLPGKELAIFFIDKTIKITFKVAVIILKLPKIKFNKLIFSPTNEAARSASQRV